MLTLVGSQKEQLVVSITLTLFGRQEWLAVSILITMFGRLIEFAFWRKKKKLSKLGSITKEHI